MSPTAMLSETVVTLVAGEKTGLEVSFVTHLAVQTKASHFIWLADGNAVDLFYAEWIPDELRIVIKEELADRPFDVFVQSVAYRRKRLLVADMESTIIEQEMLDELAEFVGLRDKISDITRRAMNGELDFKAALGERVGLLKGQSQSILEQVAQRITIMPGASTLISTMKAQGAQCWLVSGGFTCFANPVAEQLGFDQVYANNLLLKDGVITGEISDPILDKNAKKILLEKACKEFGLPLTQSLSVGDGANDILMLGASNAEQGLGVAYHAKPNVRAVVPHQINHGDLTALLYAQGYSKAEFSS